MITPRIHARLILPSVLLGVLLLAACSGGGGRRAPVLPTYMNRIQSARTVSFVPNGPSVDVGSSGNMGMLGLATDLATMGVADEVHEKLKRSVAPEDLSQEMTGVFSDGLAQTFSWEVTTDAKAPTDTRVEVTIRQYGLAADSPESQVYFSFIADARVIFLPENRLIWEATTRWYEPVQSVHVQNAGAVGSVVNFAVLLEIEPERFREIMFELAGQAGYALIDRMRQDSVWR